MHCLQNGKRVGPISEEGFQGARYRMDPSEAMGRAKGERRIESKENKRTESQEAVSESR